MKIAILALFLVCATPILIVADVIRMEDGTIYLGKVVKAEEGGIMLEAFGKELRVSPSAILRSESDYETLRAQPVEVLLKDGSVIRGKVKDYDTDIGLLVDIDFGALTIPLESLSAIEDPQQRTRFEGFPVQLGLMGGFSAPVGPLGATFGPGFAAWLFAEFNLAFVRGLYVGVEVSQFFVSYLPGGTLSYSITTATAGPIYRLLALRSSPIPVVRDLVPWLGLGAGIAYVGVRDSAGSLGNGEIDPVGCASIGLDFYAGKRLLIRLAGRWLVLPQTTTALHLPSAGLGAAYSF
jgi:hypothetical protein